MIDNLNLLSNKELSPGVPVPSDAKYYLSPTEYNTLLEKLKELITDHNTVSQNVTTNVSFKSTVFRRTNDVTVLKPTGGTFTSPVPTSVPQWFDSIPIGSEKLWASTRIFTTNGLSPQQLTWSTPAQMTDTSTVSIRFSSLEYSDSNTPGNPTTNPSNWTTSGDDNTLWMAIAIISNGKPVVASDWVISRIKGENGADGMDYEFIYTTLATTEEPYDISTLLPVQENEYLPIPSETYGIWTDDPQGVIPTKQYEWVSKRTKTSGVWGTFSKPALWARYAIDGDGQSSFKSFVFQRSNSALTEVPVGGSFASPVPTSPAGWTDSIPTGNETLWVSTRVFSSNGFTPPQEEVWTTPTIMAETAGLLVRFSKELDPGNPTDFPLNWTIEADAETIWMATAITSGNTAPIAGDWSIAKIKGEGGTGINVATVYLYQRKATEPTNALGDLTYTFATGMITESVSPWSQLIPENDGNPIWVMFATVTALGLTDTITQSEWSDPVILSKDGANTVTVNLYQRSETTPNPATPSSDCVYTFSTHILTGTLAAWSESVPAVNGSPLWVISATAYATIDTDTIAIDDWSDPVMMMKDGDDGPGYEFIFKLTTTNVAPATPATSQDDGYVPSGWSDDALTVSEVNSYQWVSQRKKSSIGVWGNFTDPTLWSKYSTDGVNGTSVSNGFVHYQIASATPPLAPTATSYNFATGQFTGLSSNWSLGAPTYSPGTSNKYWYSTFFVSETSGGVGTPTFGPVIQAIGFSGLVTFTDGDSVTDGTNQLSFGQEGTTSIYGSNIYAGKIRSSNFSAIGGDGFTEEGMEIDLDNSKITGLKFKMTTDGLVSMVDADINGVLTSGAMIMGEEAHREIELDASGLKIYGTGVIFTGSGSISSYSGDIFTPYGDFYTTNGTMSATAFYQTSDRNKKSNIFPINPYKLSDSEHIQFKQFTLNSDETETVKYGVIAQDIEYLFPELVQTNENNEKSVDYISLFALKFKALEEKIKVLENKIIILESK